MSKDLAIEDLVLDLVGSNLKYPVVLGPGPHGQCYEGVKILKNLSVRGINLVGLRENFTNCFPNLEAVSGGFNAPFIDDDFKQDNFSKQNKLRYLDISYLNWFSN